MIIETLLFKGGLMLFKLAKSKVFITKAISHSIASQGIVATAATVGQVCVVVGGIKLAADNVNCLRSAISDLKKGNLTQGAQKLARVLATVNQITHISSLADLVHDFAISEGFSYGKAKRIRAEVIGLSNEIKRASN